jgi:hypothetical protein
MVLLSCSTYDTIFHVAESLLYSMFQELLPILRVSCAILHTHNCLKHGVTARPEPWKPGLCISDETSGFQLFQTHELQLRFSFHPTSFFPSSVFPPILRLSSHLPYFLSFSAFPPTICLYSHTLPFLLSTPFLHISPFLPSFVFPLILLLFLSLTLSYPSFPPCLLPIPPSLLCICTTLPQSLFPFLATSHPWSLVRFPISFPFLASVLLPVPLPSFLLPPPLLRHLPPFAYPLLLSFPFFHLPPSSP